MSGIFLPPTENIEPIGEQDVRSMERQALDDATYEPQSYVGMDRDYQQSETIAASFETVVDNAVTESPQEEAPPDIEQQHPETAATPPDIEQQHPETATAQQIVNAEVGLPEFMDTQEEYIEAVAQSEVEADDGLEPPHQARDAWDTAKPEAVATVGAAESMEPQLSGDTGTADIPKNVADMSHIAQENAQEGAMEAELPEREMLPKEEAEIAENITGIGTQGAFEATNTPETIPGVGKPAGPLGDFDDNFDVSGFGGSSGGGTPGAWGNFPGQEGHGGQKGADYGENFGSHEPHGQGGGSGTSSSGLPMHNYGPGMYGEGSNKDGTPELPGMVIGGGDTLTAEVNEEECAGAATRVEEVSSFRENDTGTYILDCGGGDVYIYDGSTKTWTSQYGQDIDGTQPIPYTGKMFYEGNPEEELKKDHTGGHDEDSGHVMPMVSIDGHDQGPGRADPGELDDTGRAYGGISGTPKMHPDSGGALPIDPIPASQADTKKK